MNMAFDAYVGSTSGAYPAGAAPAKPVAESPKPVALRFVTDAAEWDALMAAAPEPHFTQDFAYAAGKAAAGWPARRVLFLIDDRPVAFAVVLEWRRFGIRLLNRVNRGPIFLSSNPTDETVVAVYRALRRRFGRFWTAPLLIAPALHQGERSDRLMRAAGYRRRAPSCWASGRIDLTVGEERLWASFDKRFRNRARVAEKAGATVRAAEDAETFEWMLGRHEENMELKCFASALPMMLRAYREAATHKPKVYQLLHQGQPVAGMVVARFGQVAEYYVSWFSEEGRKLSAGASLMWHVMRDLQRQGVRSFDVGGLKQGEAIGGYAQFKRTMNPVEYELADEWMSF